MHARLWAPAALSSAAVVLSGVANARPAPPTLGPLPGPYADLVLSFAFDPHAPGTVYAGTISGHVYKTADGGRHWRSTAWIPAGVNSNLTLAADPRRPGTVYAGNGSAVFETVDGGRSWRARDRGLLPSRPTHGRAWVSALAVDPSDGDVFASVGFGGIRKSTDGGRSWRAVFRRDNLAVGPLVIAPGSPSVVYAMTFEPGDARHASAYRSVDGGRTWRPTGLQSGGLGFALAVDPQRPATLYAVTETDVLRSTDGGRSWQSIANGLPAGDRLNVLAVDPRRAGTVYAGMNLNGIYRTTDGGRTWAVAG